MKFLSHSALLTEVIHPRISIKLVARVDWIVPHEIRPRKKESKNFPRQSEKKAKVLFHERKIYFVWIWKMENTSIYVMENYFRFRLDYHLVTSSSSYESADDTSKRSHSLYFRISTWNRSSRVHQLRHNKLNEPFMLIASTFQEGFHFDCFICGSTRAIFMFASSLIGSCLYF